MYRFSFLLNKAGETHSHTDVEFFYVIGGSALFTLEDKQFRLEKDDFLVVNVDKAHSYTADGDFLGACIRFSYSELCSLMKQSMIFFWCNTKTGNTEACDELRRIFKKIISQEYLDDGKDVIYLTSLVYELLHVLTTDFLMNKDNAHYTEETHKFDLRKHEISAYIQRNFDKPISLEDLAQQMFLSYAYLSKYIKRHFGMGFSEYLNQVRLNFAVSQLLHSDLSVVRIALDAGFASSAALNKAFKQAYNMTPTEYRRKWGSRQNEQKDDIQNQARVHELLERHLNNWESAEQGKSNLSAQTIVMGNTQRRVLRRNWCRMINMGAAEDLLQSEVQNHLIKLKDELHFEYVRFWDLHSPHMMMGDAKTGFNFGKLDHVIDFILQNGMKPYIELRPKPKLVMKSALQVISWGVSDVPEQEEDIAYYMRKLFIHLINRYGTEEIEKWYFEFWHSEAEVDALNCNFVPAPNAADEYLRRFRVVSNEMRKVCPGVRLGGGGFSLRYGEDHLTKVLTKWGEMEEKPDFISMYCYPYTAYNVGRMSNRSRSTDFLRQSLKFTRELMDQVGFDDKELHVSEWNFSISSRNVLNDHCMKGAYLVRDMITGLDYADLMGYWVGSDMFSIAADAKTIVFGGGGLLSRDGIRKPAFYALDFMNHLGRYVRKKDDNYIITDNGQGNWRILCHNLKNLNHQYSQLDEGEIRIPEQDNLFEDTLRTTLHFNLPAKKTGKYILKCLTVNKYSGSLQDEWMAMSSPREMTMDEIKYLSRIVTPRMLIKNLTSDNGHLLFDIHLEPNEIAYLHVIYQYS